MFFWLTVYIVYLIDGVCFWVIFCSSKRSIKQAWQNLSNFSRLHCEMLTRQWRHPIYNNLIHLHTVNAVQSRTVIKQWWEVIQVRYVSKINMKYCALRFSYRWLYICTNYSGSFMLIDFYLNWKPIYRYISVTICNLSFISHCFRDLAQIHSHYSRQTDRQTDDINMTIADKCLQIV